VSGLRQDTKRFRWLWFLVGALVVAGVFYMFTPKVRAVGEHQRKKAALIAENRALEDAVRDRRNKRERFASDPEFVERTAHEAGLVKSDEVVFKFTNVPTRPPVAAPRTR
jgi:cell division protein FtsB